MKILITRVLAIGDVIHTLSAPFSLKKQHKNKKAIPDENCMYTLSLQEVFDRVVRITQGA